METQKNSEGFLNTFPVCRLARLLSAGYITGCPSDRPTRPPHWRGLRGEIRFSSVPIGAPRFTDASLWMASKSSEYLCGWNVRPSVNRWRCSGGDCGFGCRRSSDLPAAEVRSRYWFGDGTGSSRHFHRRRFSTAPDDSANSKYGAGASKVRGARPPTGEERGAVPCRAASVRRYQTEKNVRFSKNK